MRARGWLEDVPFMSRAHPTGEKKEAPGVAWMPSASGLGLGCYGEGQVSGPNLSSAHGAFSSKKFLTPFPSALVDPRPSTSSTRRFDADRLPVSITIFERSVLI